jgi:hypothetical protein
VDFSPFAMDLRRSSVGPLGTQSLTVDFSPFAMDLRRSFVELPCALPLAGT